MKLLAGIFTILLIQVVTTAWLHIPSCQLIFSSVTRLYFCYSATPSPMSLWRRGTRKKKTRFVPPRLPQFSLFLPPRLLLPRHLPLFFYEVFPLGSSQDLWFVYRGGFSLSLHIHTHIAEMVDRLGKCHHIDIIREIVVTVFQFYLCITENIFWKFDVVVEPISQCIVPVIAFSQIWTVSLIVNSKANAERIRRVEDCFGGAGQVRLKRTRYVLNCQDYIRLLNATTHLYKKVCLSVSVQFVEVASFMCKSCSG